MRNRQDAPEALPADDNQALRAVEVESLIGCFDDTWVIRTRLEGNPTFREVMSQVRQTVLEAYQQQDLPFELLVEKLQLEHSLSYNPLFQVMFVLQNPARGETISDPSCLASSRIQPHDSLSISPVELNWGTSLLDLTLSLQEFDSTLHGYWEYKSDLFERATIERMATHFQTLLEGIVANPDQPIAYLPLLTESEKHQLLVEWNECAASRGTVWRADYPSDKCIHQLFEEQVERTPNATAVVFADQQFTYQELNARANQLAFYLIAQGVGPDVLVGICVERSIEMVVGLLGILKAGGAYVPLDPSYPNERLQFMLEDAKVPLLLTQERLVPTLPQLVPLLCLDQEWEFIHTVRDSNPQTAVGPDHLAYCIYTSGSTGSPKGVVVSHGNLVTNQEQIRAAWSHDTQSVMVCWAPLFHDMGLVCGVMEARNLPMIVLACSCLL